MRLRCYQLFANHGPWVVDLWQEGGWKHRDLAEMGTIRETLSKVIRMERSERRVELLAKGMLWLALSNLVLQGFLFVLRYLP